MSAMQRECSMREREHRTKEAWNPAVEIGQLGAHIECNFDQTRVHVAFTKDLTSFTQCYYMI